MLYLVPTPIGNLEDITLRALRVLREADLIACEDTRTSGILLRHYGIDRSLTSFHVHNENEKLPFLLGKLRAGETVAVITDAGTPGISDPGWILLRRALDEGLGVDVLPGASALVPAVLLSGLKPQPFVFLGFPPEKVAERERLFRSVRELKCTLCFYVSPHKAKHIAGMLEVFGNRRAALVREISKMFQETIRGDLAEVLERVKEGVKGELVLVVEGYESESVSWREEAEEMFREGRSVRDIVSGLEDKASRNEIKKFLVGLRHNQKPEVL